MTKKIDLKEYQKPELTHIDDSAFDETGQGSSALYQNGNNGNHYGSGNDGGNNGNHYGGGNGGGRDHK